MVHVPPRPSVVVRDIVKDDATVVDTSSASSGNDGAPPAPLFDVAPAPDGAPRTLRTSNGATSFLRWAFGFPRSSDGATRWTDSGGESLDPGGSTRSSRASDGAANSIDPGGSLQASWRKGSGTNSAADGALPVCLSDGGVSSGLFDILR